jgi:stearoyl-CoA desaturase (delta-9 desaturase)
MKRSAVATIYETPGHTDAVAGEVAISWPKALWVGGMYAGAVTGGIATFAWDAVAVFLALCAGTLCLGHSLGMHRLLIHRSYECPRLLEYFLVYCGVLVGIAGPRGMMKTHDTRDWAQRQARCHDYFAHRQPFLVDGGWQMFCEVRLQRPPRFCPPAAFDNDRVYRILERTWMLQQAPVALLLLAIGGWPWLVWGTCVRVAVCVTGHWLIGYFAHNAGRRTYHVDGASVQGYNVPLCGLITMGESWHNNHHAFPGSAKLGLSPREVDPGWWVLQALARMHLVWNIKVQGDLPPRKELRLLGAIGRRVAEEQPLVLQLLPEGRRDRMTEVRHVPGEIGCVAHADHHACHRRMKRRKL